MGFATMLLSVRPLSVSLTAEWLLPMLPFEEEEILADIGKPVNCERPVCLL